MRIGDRVRWRVYHPSRKSHRTFYGTVTALRGDPFRGCPRCGHGGEPGAMVRPDGKAYEGWHPLRLLEAQR